jgi:hypothetical protein
VTVRLVRTAVANWETLDGYAVAHGMEDLRTLELDRFCNFVWFMMTRHAEKKDADQMRAKLWVPPPKATGPIPRNSPWSAEAETAAFKAVKAQLVSG